MTPTPLLITKSVSVPLTGIAKNIDSHCTKFSKLINTNNQATGIGGVGGYFEIPPWPKNFGK